MDNVLMKSESTQMYTHLTKVEVYMVKYGHVMWYDNEPYL